MKGLTKKVGLYLALLLATSVVVPSAFGQGLPSFGNVVIVVGENQNFSTSYNSSNMPYLTSLANTYGIGVNYYSDTHPSIGNYLNLATGNILTDDDSRTPQNFPVSLNNIALEVQNAGGTWKDYVENLPTNASCKGLNPGTYYVRHDPLEYMTTLDHETGHFVCFGNFATDLLRRQLPNLSWLVPNGCDDAHDCSIQTFDNWLRDEIGGLLLTSPYFRPGGTGLLIILFDENNDSGSPDCETTTEGQGCGGQVEMVVVSPFSKRGYQSPGGDTRNYNNSYDEGDILRLMAQGLGLPTSNLGWATNGLPMADFFSTQDQH
ncbi:MAG: alkaline phosphatase family protein [Candidatus Korobacteraceae bacterium]